MNWGEFFAMGGYAFYVWSSWGLSLVVLAYLFTKAKWQHARIKRDIARQLRREQLQNASDDT